MRDWFSDNQEMSIVMGVTTWWVSIVMSMAMSTEIGWS